MSVAEFNHKKMLDANELLVVFDVQYETLADRFQDIGSEFRVQSSGFRVSSSRVAADGQCSQYGSRSGIADITHWIKRIADHDEDNILLITAV